MELVTDGAGYCFVDHQGYRYPVDYATYIDALKRKDALDLEVCREVMRADLKDRNAERAEERAEERKRRAEASYTIVEHMSDGIVYDITVVPKATKNPTIVRPMIATPVKFTCYMGQSSGKKVYVISRLGYQTRSIAQLDKQSQLLQIAGKISLDNSDETDAGEESEFVAISDLNAKNVRMAINNLGISMLSTNRRLKEDIMKITNSIGSVGSTNKVKLVPDVCGYSLSQLGEWTVEWNMRSTLSYFTHVPDHLYSAPQGVGYEWDESIKWEALLIACMVILMPVFRTMLSLHAVPFIISGMGVSEMASFAGVLNARKVSGKISFPRLKKYVAGRNSSAVFISLSDVVSPSFLEEVCSLASDTGNQEEFLGWPIFFAENDRVLRSVSALDVIDLSSCAKGIGFDVSMLREILPTAERIKVIAKYAQNEKFAYGIEGLLRATVSFLRENLATCLQRDLGFIDAVVDDILRGNVVMHDDSRVVTAFVYALREYITSRKMQGLSSVMDINNVCERYINECFVVEGRNYYLTHSLFEKIISSESILENTRLTKRALANHGILFMQINGKYVESVSFRNSEGHRSDSWMLRMDINKAMEYDDEPFVSIIQMMKRR